MELQDFFDKQFEKYDLITGGTQNRSDKRKVEDSIDEPPRFGANMNNENDYSSPEKQEKLLDDFEKRIKEEKMRLYQF